MQKGWWWNKETDLRIRTLFKSWWEDGSHQDKVCWVLIPASYCSPVAPLHAVPVSSCELPIFVRELVLRRLDGVPFAGALQASPASSRGLTVGPGPRHPYGISSSDGSAQFSRSDLRKMSIPGRPQGE